MENGNDRRSANKKRTGSEQPFNGCFGHQLTVDL
jgi:hypothetical protein